MDLPILVLAALMAATAITHPALVLAGRGASPMTQVLAGLMGLTAIAVGVFLFSDDDYTDDGRSNWSAYDVEYVALPTIAGLLGAGVWLQRRAGSREANVASPVLGLALSFLSLVCLVFTNN